MLGIDTVTYETPDEVSHMRANRPESVISQSQANFQDRMLECTHNVCRREENINNVKVSLTWSPEDKRRRGRPKTTWRRTVENEWRRPGFTSWTQIENVAKERARWKELTYGLTTPPPSLRC